MFELKRDEEEGEDDDDDDVTAETDFRAISDVSLSIRYAYIFLQRDIDPSLESV